MSSFKITGGKVEDCGSVISYNGRDLLKEIEVLEAAVRGYEADLPKYGKKIQELTEENESLRKQLEIYRGVK